MGRLIDIVQTAVILHNLHLTGQYEEDWIVPPDDNNRLENNADEILVGPDAIDVGGNQRRAEIMEYLCKHPDVHNMF